MIFLEFLVAQILNDFLDGGDRHWNSGVGSAVRIEKDFTIRGLSW